MADDGGFGKNGGPAAGGPGGECVCPECGHMQRHETDVPCSETACAECGTMMERKTAAAMSDGFRGFMALAAHGDEDDKGRKWFEILELGAHWPKPMADTRGPFKLTQELFDSIKANFRGSVPVDLHHASLSGKTDPESTRARAWWDDVKQEGDKLLALTRFTGTGRELVDDGGFAFFSAEILEGRDPKTGKENGPYLRGGTLTNTPVLGLQPIVMSDALEDQFTNELTAHAGGAIVEPEQVAEPSGEPTNVRTKENPMTDEIKALTEQLGTLEEDKATALAEVADLKDKLAAAEKAAEEQSTALADQVEASNKRATELAEQVRKIREDTAIEHLLAAGKIKADEEEIAREMYALSEDMFGKVYDSREKGAAVPVGDMAGSQREDNSGNSPKNPQVEFNALCEAKLAECSGDWDKAEAAAKAEKPDLYMAMAEQMASAVSMTGEV